MGFLPFQNITFRTKLDETEVCKKLKLNIAQKKPTHSPYVESRKPYEGDIAGNNFKINRIIWYRNSFRPVLHGTVIPDLTGSKIIVKMRLHLLVLILVCISAAFAFILFLLSLTKINVFGLLHENTLVPLGFLVFIYLMTIIAFNLECRKSKKDFKEILDAEIEE